MCHSTALLVFFLFRHRASSALYTQDSTHSGSNSPKNVLNVYRPNGSHVTCSHVSPAEPPLPPPPRPRWCSGRGSISIMLLPRLPPRRSLFVRSPSSSREPRAESREPRAESREPRAESREPRAKSREPRRREIIFAGLFLCIFLPLKHLIFTLCTLYCAGLQPDV
jgi:hypothetical protein